MSDVAFWRRLDHPGRDAAILTRTESGWSLHGSAVFRHGETVACLHYSVDLNPDWSTRQGRVDGFLSDRQVHVLIVRDRDGWTRNGVPVPGLTHLVDLDLGFTPATNHAQLRRVALRVGDAIDLPVAWLDADAAELIALPQRYERHSDTMYWYEAPTVRYRAMLELAPSGFVRTYPGLWQAEL